MDLFDTVMAKKTLEPLEAAKVINALKSTILEELNAGRDFTIYGFGTFKVVETPARKYRDLQTGEILTTKPMKKVKFIPSKALKDKVR